jgi:HAD superfamily hydrolase (TIGR01544 family)
MENAKSDVIYAGGDGGASAAPAASQSPFLGGGAGAAAVPGGLGAGRTFASSPAAAASKTDAICAGGTALLHVIIDWDRTCTTFMHNGKKGDTCHGVVESRRGPELLAQARALNAKYLPIETDPLLPHGEKIPHMRDWYAAVNGLLAASGITREDLREDVRAANLGLRDGIPQLLRASVARGFPITILSAGIGDVIEEALAQLVGPLPPHIRVVSNKMIWREGRCVGFSEPTIHSAFNTRRLPPFSCAQR